MFNIGPAELMVILMLALIIFGPKKMPEIGRNVGKGLKEFRRATNDVKRELRLQLDEPKAATDGVANASKQRELSATAGMGRSSPMSEAGPDSVGVASPRQLPPGALS